MKCVDIWTDGSCDQTPGPGPGGWGAILRYGKHIKKISGHVDKTTNNRMELTAVIEALKSLTEIVDVIIISDSQFIVDAINKDWLTMWKNNNWWTKQDVPLKNADLWKEVYNLLGKYCVTMQWVKGHSGDKWNTIADELARSRMLS